MSSVVIMQVHVPRAAARSGGVARRMFSRPKLENGGRKSVLSHMLFNKL